MSLIDSIRYRLSIVFRPREHDRELTEEIDSHLDLESMQRSHRTRDARGVCRRPVRGAPAVRQRDLLLPKSRDGRPRSRGSTPFGETCDSPFVASDGFSGRHAYFQVENGRYRDGDRLATIDQMA